MTTVKELREIVNRHHDTVADSHLSMLHKRKLGFTFNQVFNKHSEIIDGIVLDALLEANEPLLETSEVRIPSWMNSKLFKQFIAKILSNAHNNIS